MTPERKGIHAFETIALDAARMEVRRNGRRVDLEPKAFQVLSYLIENRDRVVTKEELLGAVWAGTFVTDNALTRVIAQIRKQLGDNARSPRLIETVSTAGYRFIGHAVQEGGSPPPAEIPVAAVSRPAYWRWAAAIAAALALATLVWRLGRPAVTPGRVAGLRQLTSSPGQDLFPAFSPDGSQIAFSSDRTGRFEIYVRSLAPGSAERQITSDGANNTEPAWSPNGQEIAFTGQERGGISIVPATGGPLRHLTNEGSAPDWSPDGRTLVYRAGSVGKVHLWLASLDGTPPRPLTQSGTPRGDHEYPRWLADGRHVLFSAFFPTNGRPWIVDTATGQLQPIEIATGSVMFAHWPGRSPFLYFTTPGSQGATPPLDPVGVWRARINSRSKAETPELLIPSAGLTPIDLAITADGSRIAISQMRQENALWSLSLSRSGSAAGDPQPLLQDASIGLSDPQFSADGSRLAYTSMHQGGGWTLYTARPDGSASLPLTAAGESVHTISWIGSNALAYIADRHGQKDYWLAPLQGAPKLLSLPLDLGPYAVVLTSPDGTRVVAHAGNRATGIKLVLIDVATGRARDLTPAGRTFVFPSWSPDGKWLSAVERIDPATDRRVAIEAATGTIQVLGDAPDDPLFFHSNWAPDNDRIAYSDWRDGLSNLYWISRTTHESRQLTHFRSQSERVSSPAWSPRGDQIVFVHSAKSANIYAGDLRY